MKKNSHESVEISYSNSESIKARMEIFRLMNEYNSTDEEKERSLGLFLRSSLLARILAITEIYKLIVNKPGAILDIGTWRGQTAVLCENLRSIFEPLHFNRRILCFDTFDGYKGFSNKDKPTNVHNEGTYSLNGDGYVDILNQLLMLHEKSNAMGHNNNKHKVIKGDCRKTIPKFFKEFPNEYVALAFFDVNSYDPTLESFEHVWSRLIPDGVMAFWQLSRDKIPAEGRVYSEKIIGKYNHKIFRSQSYPGLCYLIKG